MNIGIVGLGLIGGSMARAIKDFTEHSVFGYDISESSFLAATLTGAVDKKLDENTVGKCDIIILSLYPEDAVEYIKKTAGLIKKNCIVFDCCGIKRYICEKMKFLSKENGFIFIGGHPMAGTHYWGFEHSRASMFKGASMILVPDDDTEIEVLEKIKNLCLSIGFGEIKFTTPEEHDKVIAFTSQLPHVVSNAYVKSDNAAKHKGFSAGSYKDLSRVAKLNEKMWTELFLENGDFLAEEIDALVDNLKQYSSAIKNKDAEKLKNLLKDGSEKKRIVK